MISRHCGIRLVVISDNPAYTRWKCFTCGRVFKQRKRQKKVKLPIAPDSPGQSAC